MFGVLGIVAVLARFGPAFASSSTPSQSLFGPKQYLRTTGSPNKYSDTFSVSIPANGPFTLRVVNGDANDGHRVSSATVTLNGKSILSQNDFSQRAGTLERSVTVKSSNTLQVTLASAPGSYLIISVLGPHSRPVATTLKPDPLSLRSGTSGTLTATLSPVPTASGRLAVRTTVRSIAAVPTSVSFSAGQASVPVPVTAGAAGSAVVSVCVDGDDHDDQDRHEGSDDRDRDKRGDDHDRDKSGDDRDRDKGGDDHDRGKGGDDHDRDKPGYDRDDDHREVPPATASATVIVTNPPPPNRPPVVSAGGPYSGTAGQPVAFAGTATDPDNDPLTIAWSFGDGQSGSGRTPSHTYTSSGSFTAVISADDGRGGQTTASATVTIAAVPPPNHPPMATAGGPYSGTTGQSITFAGAASDPDNDPLVVTWSFGDGTTGVGATPTHAYSSHGTFTAIISADDGRGGHATASATVTMTDPLPENHPPVVGAGGPYSGTAGTPIAFSGTASDPDNDPLAITWDFGDGSTGTGISPTHTYAAGGSFTAAISADDGRGGHTTASASVTVTTPPPPNRPPVVNAGGPYNGMTGQSIAFAASGSDPDGDALAFSWDFGDGTPAAIDAQASHSYASAGTYTATVTANDGRGGVAFANAQVAVTNPTSVNHDPVIVSTPQTIATVGQQYTYAVMATDVDAGDILTFSLTQAPGGMTISSGGAIVWTPAAADAPSVAVTVRVQDGRGGSATQSFTIAVAAGNHAPVFTSSPVTTGSEARPYQYQATASDADGDTLTFSLVDAPAGMSIAVSGSIAWTPAKAQAGSNTVSVKVSDSSGAFAIQAFAIVVTPNTAPAIGSTPPATAVESSAYRYDVVATDADGDPLAFQLLQSPAGMSIASSGRIDWTPASDQTGSQSVSVEVRDDRGGRATQTFTIAVAALNRPPHIDSTPVTTAREGLLYNYQVHATDPNGDPVTYLLTAAPTGMSVDSGTGLISWTPASGSPASIQIGVTASDGVGGSDAQTFTIAVTAASHANQAPRITSTPDTTGATAALYVYDVHAEDPDPGDVLTFSLVQPPSGMTIDSASGHVSWTPSAGQSGAFPVIVHVTDGKDAAQQAYELTIVAPSPVNHAPVANVGGPYHGEAGQAIAFSGAGSSDPDGDTLSYSWDFGDSSDKGTGAAPAHLYKDAGSFVVTLTVADGHGGESSRSTSVAVGAAGDRSPPSVTLLGPREVLPGDQITITAQAVDNVSVEKVTFEVDGGSPVETSTPPFQRAIAVPAVAAPGTTISVRATAVDPSGNAGAAETTLTIKARPDTEKPTVTLNAPPIAAPGTSIHVSASATDNAGIQSVGFSVNGGSIATVTQPPYEATYAIPVSAPVGSALTVSAFALDFSANRSDASASISIIDTPDTQPPTVQLSASGTVVPGTTLTLSAVAADNRGVSTVEFFVDGVKIASDTDAPYSAAFAIPADAASGRALQLEAHAVDFAGLVGTDSRQALVVAASSLGQGVITGEVYDDTTGLPADGVGVSLIGADVSGRPYTQTSTTNGRGQYLIQATEGTGLVRLTRAGWTQVDRPVDIVAGKALEAFDARITPLSAQIVVNPILGATLTAAGAQTTLSVPTGGLAVSTPISVTAVGAQGLEGLLPPGWSVLGATDVAPHAAAFSTPATLTLPAVSGVSSGAPLALARWDEQAAAWHTVSTRPADAQPLSAGISEGGQYAWVIADTLPAAPPAAVAGAALSGVVVQIIPIDAATVVAPQSKILLYQPGVHSDVTGSITPAAPMTSGTPVIARISETYAFTSGLHAQPEAYVQDLVLYQWPSAATLTAHHIVTPSLSFEPLSLSSGAITIELLAPAAGPRLSDVIGDAGGSATSASGERVDVAAHVLTFPAPVHVRSIVPADLGFDLPPAVAFAGGLELAASGAQFALPVTISIPKPSQLPNDAQILIARIADVGTTSRLVLVAIGRVAGDRVESTSQLGDNPDALEGVRAEGRYLFLQPASPVGFAAGLVHAINGDPFSGALVSVDTFPLFAISRSGGQYVAAASIGAATLTAQDVVRNDSGTAQGTVAPTTVAAIDIRLSADVPRVLTITPADQASNVPLSNPIVITFSEPLNPLSITPASVVLTGPDGAPVLGTLSLSNNNSVVTLRPASALPPDSAFTVTIASTITDLSSYTLEGAVTSHFTSLDVTAPPPPPAGAISATLPGADGNTTITATQGTANLHDTVSILNVTQGTTVPVLLDPNGGFSVLVQASLTDQLKLKIVDAAGNATLVALPRFSRTNANGSVSFAVDAQGGRIDGPGGVSAAIAPGTFPNGAIVTIKPVAEADFPVQLTAEQRQVFQYSGGIELDFGGQVPTQYVNVSIPAGPADRTDDRWVVSMVDDFNGQKMLHVVDTAKLLDGRVTTASPPCPGVNASAVYGFHKADRPVGVTYGDFSVTSTPLIIEVLGIPWVVTAIEGDSTPMCFPVLSGRVTIVPNTVSLSVPVAQITPGTSRIVVTNLSRNNEESAFRRETVAIPVTVIGSVTDNFSVTGSKTFGSVQQALSFKKSAGVGGFVKIELGFDTIAFAPDEVIIQNTTTIPLAPLHIAGNTLAVLLPVAGGTADTFAVHLDDPAIGAAPSAAFTLVPSSLGGGNLVARAALQTIDPTQAEIDAYNAAHPGEPLTAPARTKVEIVAPGLDVEIPAASIVNGGFAFAFQGSATTQYAVVVTYADDHTDSILIPQFKMTISDPSTGAVVNAIVLPSPPPDQPLNLGRLSNDHVPPKLTNDLTTLQNFDPSNILTFTFSESMDAASLKNFVLADASGNQVAGDIRVSDRNRTLTFVPASALELAKIYTALFYGVTDRGGNRLSPRTLRVQTVAPRLVGSMLIPTVRDLQIRKKDVGGTPSVFLVATTNTQLGNSLVTLDVTDPANPSQAGAALAGYHKRQATIVPDVTGLALSGPTGCGGGTTFNGDLAVTTSFITDFTYVSFFDVTDTSKPCLMSNKILTATPDSELFPAVEHGTYHVFGLLARGVATISHSGGIAAYSAIAEAGLFFTDVGSNVPELAGSRRQQEPMLPGNYYDVAAYSAHLLALNRDARQLEVIDPELAVLSVLPLPDAPRRIIVAQGFPFDANGNGTIEPGEFVDAAFIGGDKSIAMVDVGNLQAPRLLGTITMPTWINDLDVDRSRRRLAAVDIQNSLHLIDLARIQAGAMVDANLDGLDDRIAWTHRMTDTAWAVRLDKERPYVYVGTDRGVDIYAMSAPNLSGLATYSYIPTARGIGLDYANQDDSKPIRGALVELRTGGGALLQSTTTDDTGYYSFDAPLNTQIEVFVKAVLARPENPTEIHLDVRDNFGADAIGHEPTTNLELVTDKVWAKTSGKFTITAPTRKDIAALTVWTPGAPRGTHTKREGAPFAILDTIYQGEKTIRQVDPAIRFPMLHMYWSPKNQGSNGATNAGLIGTTAYHSDEVAIYILGAENVDTDENDPQVMLHEWSHYFEDKFSRSDSIGDSHSFGDKLDPRVAFGEGFATAHASMLSGNSDYIDTSGQNQATASLTDLEADNSNASSFFSEDGVMELLWDLFDPKSPAGSPENDAESGGTIQDNVELTYKPIYQAMTGGEKRTPAFTSVFSFLHALMAPYLADPALMASVGNSIIALAKAEGINLDTADEYEHTTRTLYTVLPPDGTALATYPSGTFAGQALQTRTTNDPALVGNKLDDHVFFKLHIVIPGTYQIDVVPKNNKSMHITLSDHGSLTNSAGVTTGVTATVSASLQPGDYVVDVYAHDFVAAPAPGAWVNATNATFTIKATLTSLATP